MPQSKSSLLIFCLLLMFLAGCDDAPVSEVETRWYKGNLHTHSLWSDGDDYPEMIIKWYKDSGYNFLALSDHNTLAEGERWSPIDLNSGGRAAFERYKATFGEEWVEERLAGDTAWVRLKTFDEYRSRFEEDGSFLMVASEEISDGFDGKPIHVNATNIQAFVRPQGGTSVRDVMQQNVNAVLAQRDSLGIPMFPHINHPNFGWAITAEDLIALEGEQFFEVYNGHPMVRNHGDEDHPGMERVWDIILTRRLLSDLPLTYGIAVDDSHNYHEMGINQSNTGRAWVMVNASSLTAESLIESMEAGNFYGSSGVVLSNIVASSNRLSLTIESEEGVSYQTMFIGTRVSHDTSSVAHDIDGEAVSRRYSESVGETLAIEDGLTPSYAFNGDELYVRARVISTRPKQNPYHEGEFEMAWVQPVVVRQAGNR